MNIEYSYIKSGAISEDNILFYNEFGYLICPDLLLNDEVHELKKETVQIFKGNRGNIEGLIKVDENEPDAEVLKKYVAIHFPHKISSIIKRYLSDKKITGILTKIIGPNVKCMQSMLFVKAPGKAGQAWHQDEYYIPTRDKSLVGAWIAIDDATIGNGCLWIIPGSHKPGFIRPRVTNKSNEYADVDTVDIKSFPKKNIIPVEVKSGAVVFFNGYVLHSSLRNKTRDKFRTALVNHYMSAESMLPWDQDGKLPATEDLRDIIMVTGTDPYEHKGTEDVNQPFLRPEYY